MLSEIRWYVDRPGRELGLCPPGAKVYIDIEPGCFMDADEVRAEGTRLTQHKLVTGIYSNEGSLPEVFGASTELADWPCPLYYASWWLRPWHNFHPFNGYQMPELWQVARGLVPPGSHERPGGIAGVNCDVAFDPEGRLWADISNYSVVDAYEAYVLKNACFGIVIGLQNAGIARYQYQMLTEPA